MKKISIAIPTPEQLAALIRDHAPSCWLDSALPGHPRARFSVLGISPAEIFLRHAPLPQGFALETPAFETDPDLPFSGGWLGFVSYECFLEPKYRVEGTLGLPCAFFLCMDSGIVIDHGAARAWIFAQGSEVEAAERCRVVQEALASASVAQPLSRGTHSIHPNCSREQYLARVQKIREAIFRGDCYQVNFSQRFETCGQWDPASLYLSLRQASPAPQMAFLNGGDFQILSASPETLLQIEGEGISSFPIKGTRPRFSNSVRDAEAAQDLLASPKDAAELLMIVDLVRNDLGKFCQIGSVQVPSLRHLESFRTVHHLVAEVRGRLLPGVTAWEALRHLSPGGSITGTPKLKAMEMIRGLETEARGIYTGALGYVGSDGRAAFNIAIRTAYLRGEVLSYAAGGGIVADSVPEREYDETLHKARGFFAALGAELTIESP